MKFSSLANRQMHTIRTGFWFPRMEFAFWYSGITPIQRNVLQPGESVVFRSSALEFLAEDADEKLPLIPSLGITPRSSRGITRSAIG
jgi:hypothetical protein